MFELREIQKEFMRHFKAISLEDLNVPDGDYLVPVYDEYFNVRVTSNRIFISPPDFDESKAIRIGD